MRRADIALQFIEYFCAADIEKLERLLALKLRFRGPLLRVDNRHEYIMALQAFPLEQSQYRILSVTRSDEQVQVIYDYIKLNNTVTVSQTFVFNERYKISEMYLQFGPHD